MSNSNSTLTLERVQELLEYDVSAGNFRWLRTSRTMKAGAVAGSVERDGYVRISIDGTRYRAHRLAWLLQRGQWPVGEIDHINGQRADNRIVNLRDVTHSVNIQNQRQALSNNASSGLLGVTRTQGQLRFRAKIQTPEGRLHLGYFDSPAEAHAAYLAAKRRLHQGCAI